MGLSTQSVRLGSSDTVTSSNQLIEYSRNITLPGNILAADCCIKGWKLQQNDGSKFKRISITSDLDNVSSSSPSCTVNAAIDVDSGEHLDSGQCYVEVLIIADVV